MGFTDDLKFLVEQLRERHPSAPIFLSGFSLGGNVICKYLGEMGTAAKDIGILGAAVACVPFDAVGCQKQVSALHLSYITVLRFVKRVVWTHCYYECKKN
jgi:predicted alpha/beta-fold hydrolase